MPHNSTTQRLSDTIPPRRQVSTRERFFLSLSEFSLAINANVYGLANQIYIVALHYNANLVNIAKSIPLFAAMVTNPILGHFCDNTRTRWGRRKPWLVAGLIATVLLGLVFWQAPASDGQWAWGGFAFLALLVFLHGNIATEAYKTGAKSLTLEASTDYDERTQIFKWGSYLGALAGFIGPWFLPMCMWIEGGNAQVTKGAEGVAYVGAIIAAATLLAGLPIILFCKEKAVEHKGESKVRFLTAVQMTLHNKPFWLLVVSNFIMRFAMNVTGYFFFFLLMYYVGKGDQTLGASSRAVMYNTISVAMLLATSPIARFTTWVGKKGSLLTALIMSAVAYASLGWTFTNEEGAYVTLPVPWGAGHAFTFQWPCLISAVFIGAFTNTMPMVKYSMLADICDYDEFQSGHRREAFYNAVFNVCENVAVALSLAFQGAILAASHFDSTLTTQADSTVRFWLLAVVVSQPVGFLIAISSILFYPLSRDRMRHIRVQLDARKPAVATGHL